MGGVADLDRYIRVTEEESDPTGRVHVLDNFDIDAARALVQEYEDKAERVYVYDRSQVGDSHKIGFFGDWAPTAILALNRFYGYHLPFREKFIEEYSYSRLAHLLCTLDRSVMYSYQNRHIAASKMHNLNACANGLLLPDYCLENSLLRDVVEERTESKDVIFQVKRQALGLLKDVRMGPHSHIVKDAQPHNLSYPGKLQQMFGAHLKALLLYGSSAVGEGKDFDNIVILDRIPDDLYERIQKTGPAFKEDGKDVGFIFISEDLAEKFFFINVSNHLFLEGSKVLLGSIQFPVESRDYIVRKERYHAGFGSTKNISAVNLAFKDEAILDYLFNTELGIHAKWPGIARERKYLLSSPDKEGLFDYFMKLPRFSLQGLMYKADGETIDKTHLLAVLKDEFSYEIPAHMQDNHYIAEAMMLAMAVSAAIIHNYYRPEEQRVSNERILTIDNAVNNDVYQAEQGRTLVFRRNRPMSPGDNVPAQILRRGDDGYSSRRQLASRLGFGEDILVAKRL